MTTRKSTRSQSKGGKELQRFRSRQRWSRKRAAEELGIWPGSLFEIEMRGRVPALALAVRVEEIAGIKPKSWLQ